MLAKYVHFKATFYMYSSSSLSTALCQAWLFPFLSSQVRIILFAGGDDIGDIFTLDAYFIDALRFVLLWLLLGRPKIIAELILLFEDMRPVNTILNAWGMLR